MITEEAVALAKERPYILLTGPELFVVSADFKNTPQNGRNWRICFRLETIQAFKRIRSAWSVLFLARDDEELELAAKLEGMGVHFASKLSLTLNGFLSGPLDETALKAIRHADIVYAPACLARTGIRPKLRPFTNPDHCLAALTYFAITPTPLTVETYHSFCSTL